MAQAPVNVRIRQSREALHPQRKIFHLVTGYGFALLYSRVLTTREAYAGAMTLAALALFTAETLKIHVPACTRLFESIAGGVMRSHELKKFSGTPYFISGVAVSSWLFPRPAVILGIVCLSTLDPAASAAAFFTRPRYKWSGLTHGKSVLGALGAAVVGALVVAAMTRDWSLGLWFSVCVGVVGASAEFLIPSPQVQFLPDVFPLGIDDNAVIPVAVSAAVTMLVPMMTRIPLDKLPPLRYV